MTLQATPAECLALAERHNPRLNCFLVIRRDEIADDAARLDRLEGSGRDLPLRGMAVAIKDNIDVAGLPTTAASLVLPRVPADDDAIVVKRLKRAGAVVIGKTNMHELAYGATTSNDAIAGRVANPWATERSAGGSSSGSAVAVAVGAAVGALGTDTGGSVRIPAALTGITGLRPTTGRVPSERVVPLSWSLDMVGPMARSAADVGRLFHVIRDPTAGASNRWRVPAASPDLTGLRVGVLYDEALDGVEPEILATVAAAAESLRALGATTVRVRLGIGANRYDGAVAIVRAEAYAIFGAHLRKNPELFSDELRERFRRAGAVKGYEVARAFRDQRAWAVELKSTFRTVDTILCPTTRIVAPRFDELDPIETSSELTRLTYPWGFAGVPAISFPIGHTRGGLPIGGQLIGAHNHDEALIAIVDAYQRHTSWHLLAPGLTSDGARV